MKKLILLTNLLFLFALADAAEVKSDDAVGDSLPLIPKELIQEAGWTNNWEIDLHLENKQVDRMIVLGSDLFVMTDSNGMLCIDRKSGQVRFSRQLSVSQLPVCNPFHYDDKLWFVVGNEMLVFDLTVGDFVVKKKFPQVGSSAECGLARNEDFVYISGSGNRLHAIHVDGFWQKFTATADNDSAIVSILATDDIVVFATQAGNVVAMEPDKPQKRWQYDVTGDIKGPIVLDGEDIYVGSFDSKLYKLSLSAGKLLWDSPFHSGAPIRDSFTVGKEVIYLHNELDGVYGVHKKSGKAIWQLPSGQGMICETPEKSFIFVSPGIVKVMNNQTGKELYSVNFSGVQRYAMNTTDATMYLADTRGRLMSITTE